MSNIKSKIGAHVSMAGGIDKAPGRAFEQGCETFQCFTRSPQGGKAPELTHELVKGFKSEMGKYNMDNFYIHAPYYINFASLNSWIRSSSIKVIREELERGSVLGAKYVMAHCGSHTDQSLDEGIAKVIDAINQILDKYAGTTELLLEISAGAGSVIGDTFDEMGAMINQAKNLTGFGGVCFDTCHAFASGYDFTTPDKASEVLKDFDDKIGLEYLKLTHVNDSKTALGGKKDRHEHISHGLIGQDGLAAILRTKEFLTIDWILETEDDKRKEDVEKLKEIRGK